MQIPNNLLLIGWKNETMKGKVERKIKICQLGKDERKIKARTFSGSLGKSRQGRVNRLGLAGMNNFSWLWVRDGL